MLPTTVFWDCLLSLCLFLFLSCLFVYLRYAYTSIIQMRSQQEASGCGLSRGLAQAALNPFSAFAFTFALLAFIWLFALRHCHCVRQVLGQRVAACNTTRRFNGQANGEAVSRLLQWITGRGGKWKCGQYGARKGGLTQFKCVCVRKCFLFYFICKTDKLRTSSFKELLKCLRVEINLK